MIMQHWSSLSRCQEQSSNGSKGQNASSFFQIFLGEIKLSPFENYLARDWGCMRVSEKENLVR